MTMCSGAPYPRMIPLSAAKKGAEVRRSFGQSCAHKTSSLSTNAIVPRRVERSKASSFMQDFDSTLLFRHDVKLYPARPGRNSVRKSVRPFNYGNAVAENNFIESNRSQCCQIFDPIKIEMVNPQTVALIFMKKRERRACHYFVRAQSAYQSLNESGLACAEIADQREHISGPNVCGETCPGRFGFNGAGGNEHNQSANSDV